MASLEYSLSPSISTRGVTHFNPSSYNLSHPSQLVYILVLQTVEVEKEEKVVEEEAEVDEKSLGGYWGMLVMMKVPLFCLTQLIMKELICRARLLTAIHLMQEGVANLQAGLSQLKMLWTLLKQFSSSFVMPATSIPSTSATSKASSSLNHSPSSTPALQGSYGAIISSSYQSRQGCWQMVVVVFIMPKNLMQLSG